MLSGILVLRARLYIYIRSSFTCRVTSTYRWPKTSSTLATTLGGSKGRPSQLEAQTTSTSSPFRIPGTTRTKTDAQIAYGVGFGRTLYGWKDNSKMLPMPLVLGPNSFGVDGNHPRNLTYRICPGAAMLSFGLWALYHVGTH